MFKSNYFSEKSANSSNALVSAGIAIGFVILGIFAICWGINAGYRAIESSQYIERCKNALYYAHRKCDKVEYVGITSEEPKRNQTCAQVYKFKVTNLSDTTGVVMEKAIVKIELNSADKYLDVFYDAYRD